MADLEMPLSGEDDSAIIFTFAMSFNGDEEFGSIEASAETSHQEGRRTLREIRKELFLAAKAPRPSGSETCDEVYRDLMPLPRSYAEGPI